VCRGGVGDGECWCVKAGCEGKCREGGKGPNTSRLAADADHDSRVALSTHHGPGGVEGEKEGAGGGGRGQRGLGGIKG